MSDDCLCGEDECYWYPSEKCPIKEHAERAIARKLRRDVQDLQPAVMKLDARCVRLRRALEALSGDLLALQDVDPALLRQALQGLSDRAWRIAKEPWT